MTDEKRAVNETCWSCHGSGLETNSSYECRACSGYGYTTTFYRVALSDVAQSARERNRIRSEAKYRRGFARTARGQQRKLYKQNGLNTGD